MFVDVLNGEVSPADIFTCTYSLDPGWFHWVYADCMHPLDALVDGRYFIYVVGLLCGGVM